MKMDEAIIKVAKKWNEVAEWTGKFDQLNLPENLEIPRWLQHLIVFCMLYSTFTLCSAFYLLFGKRKTILRQHSVSLVLLKIRIFFSLCLATCPVIQMVIRVHAGTVNWVDVTVCGFMMFGWLLHQQYLRMIESEMAVHHAGHLAVNLSWVLTILALIYQVSFTFHANPLEENELRHSWDKHVLYGSAVFQFCYFFVLSFSYFVRSDGQKVQKSRIGIFIGVRKSCNKLVNFGYGLISRITFSWVDTLMLKGAKHQILNSDDLFDLPPKLQSQNIDKIFNEIYDGLKFKVKKKPRSPDVDSRSETNLNKTPKHVPLFEALIKCFGYQYFALGFLRLATDCTGFVAPVILNKLLLFLEANAGYKQQAYYYAACLCLCTLVTTLLNSQFFLLIYQIGLKVRASIISTVYRKALTTNANELTKLNVGELINFISNDADRILTFCPNFHNLWSLPLQILSCMYLLYTQVEMASLLGMCFGLAVIYTNFFLAKKIAKLGDSMMNEKDARVKLMNEALHGIQAVKFNAWERHFIRWISGMRETEVVALAGRKYLDAVCVYFWATSSMLIAFLTFFAYVYILGKTLTTSKVFTSLALINILLVPLNVFPWTINGLMEAWVSLKRIEKLLSFPELERRVYYTKLNDTPRHKIHLQIKDAMFLWGDLPQQQSYLTSAKKKKKKKPDFTCQHTNSKHISKRFVLGPINMEILEGQFIGVYGQVGAGKTSLLHAIMAEMWKTNGNVGIRRHESGFGYVSQEVWVQNGTIKDNILFGAPLELTRYQQVLESCALVEDLQKFSSGDSTEIGEKGTTLSVGQKMRIALARAMYQKRKLYLLDHPLCCIDSHVAYHIYNNCIRGLLANTTRIFCTHQMKFLYSADFVYILKDGKIFDKGPPAAVFEKKLTTLGSISNMTFHYVNDQKLKNHNNKNKNNNNNNNKKWPANITGNQNNIIIPSNRKSSATLIQDEEMAEGIMKHRVYKFVWAAYGKFLSFFIILSFTAMQASRNFTDWWLAYWLIKYTDPSNSTQLKMSHTSAIAMQPNVPSYKDVHSYNVYVYRAITMVTNYEDLDDFVCERTLPVDKDGSFFFIYTILIVINSISALLRSFLFARGGIIAAVSIHNTLLYQIFKAPMTFFHCTPIGRILNRFSTDIYAIDNNLPFMLNIFLSQAFGLIGIIIVSCYGLPWIIALIVPLFIFYLKIQHNYRCTSRAVKRISTVTLSTLYSHFSKTFSGIITIRALKAEKRFIDENLILLEKSQKAIYALQVVGIWLGLRLHVIGVAIVTAIAGLAVLQSDAASEGKKMYFFSEVFVVSEEYMSKAVIYLTMTYALAITNMLNNLVWSFTEMEKEMISCERILDYSENMGTEKWKGTVIPNDDWPSCGRISFENVTLRYLNQDQISLRNITLQVFPGEKIGIVGRTGSGKSSLFNALLRLEELAAGRIVVDGIDVSHLDISTLRSRIGIIPQDPLVFSGTIRDNLDPNHNYTSYELWTVLDKCHVVDAVHRVGGLDVLIREWGKDFSTGQKQLLCLARSLLSNTQILCIDEVTANLDQDTDFLIHQTIDSIFSGKTVLIIAHRIENVLNCHRVIVMSRGQIIEEDNPQKLLSQSSSEFYRLASRILNSYGKTVEKQTQGGRCKT